MICAFSSADVPAMDAGEFRQQIGSAYRALSERFGLVRTVSSLHSLKVDTAFNEVALQEESTYQQIYLQALSRSYYNVLLNDYSMFQFSWSGADAWRLAYLPNPWLAGVPEAEEKVRDWEALEGLGRYDDNEVALLLSELRYHGSVPPFRFEYAPGQYKELSHPSAHMHIGRHTENRWPVSKALGPVSFVLMIVKMYYVETWASYSLYYDGVAPCVDAELIAELERSRRIHDFSGVEAQSFHFHAR